MSIVADIESLLKRVGRLETHDSTSTRITTSNPQHATPGSRPAGVVGEIVYYSGKLYFCTNAATPTWEKITST